MKLNPIAVIFAGVSMLAIASCGGEPANSSSQGSIPDVAAVGEDRDVVFDAGPRTVHGSLRMPDEVDGAVPAVLLIAGSGPTDRNGDSTHIEGSVGTLRYLADVMARRGIASLRYDKFGTGATGMGPHENTSELGDEVFLHEAAAAANFLSGQSDIDDSGIGVVGHSQGGLVALALATDKAGPVPPITSLGLVQPQTGRTLDIMMRQVTDLVDAGQMSDAGGADLVSSLHRAIDQIRTSGAVPPGLPEPIRQIGLVQENAKMLTTQDELDPIAMASALPTSMKVFTSCSEKDMQVRCVDVADLNGYLVQTELRTAHLDTANHVLKDLGEGPSTRAEYGLPLPWAKQFTDAFDSWLSAR